MCTLDLYEGANLEKLASNAPFLSKEVEYDLINKVQTNQCQTSAASLVTSHLRYVVSIAKKYHVGNYPKSDLVHEGVIGLLKAINRFDQSLNFRLSSFATEYIACEIKEFVYSNFGVMKIITTKKNRKIFSNQAKINKAKAQGRLEEVADELGVTVAEIQDMEKRMNVQHSLSIGLESDEDDVIELQLGEEDDYSHLDIKKDKKNISNLLKETLNERERFVIYSRFMTDRPLKRREIAEVFGVKHQRVEQIEKRALQRLKEKLEVTESFDLGLFLS